ncbi:MAG: NADH-quinone oxidoreductase subunit NuoK [Phycisphaerae bacterium]|nr:NADH-quinone oxidoreductase subunit NuoK [Phycisphaerae bacterium]MCZ2399684.1 NADH-quinone oxidoreductase subunit NuoK [Phycisphaerae bacterium]NUQ50073.1 NADH-quinone oxidoreductase subunit NuoK [Phycisphaerae bacterium]
MYDVGLAHYLLVSTLVFAAGVATMTLKRNAIGVLIGVELVLNAASINFVAFGHYRAGGLDGQIAAVFVIVLAAAEAAVALAIFLNFYALHATVDVDRGDNLKG